MNERPVTDERPVALFDPADGDGLRACWDAIQTGFVDEPRAAVVEPGVSTGVPQHLHFALFAGIERDAEGLERRVRLGARERSDYVPSEAQLLHAGDDQPRGIGLPPFQTMCGRAWERVVVVMP